MNRCGIAPDKHCSESGSIYIATHAADPPLAARLHVELTRRIAEGDPEGAADASDKLVDYVEIFTRATVGTDFSGR